MMVKLPSRAGKSVAFGPIGGLRVTRGIPVKALGCEHCVKSGNYLIEIAGYSLPTKHARVDPRMRVCAGHAREMVEVWEGAL